MTEFWYYLAGDMAIAVFAWLFGYVVGRTSERGRK